MLDSSPLESNSPQKESATKLKKPLLWLIARSTTPRWVIKVAEVYQSLLEKGELDLDLLPKLIDAVELRCKIPLQQMLEGLLYLYQEISIAPTHAEYLALTNSVTCYLVNKISSYDLTLEYMMSELDQASQILLILLSKEETTQEKKEELALDLWEKVYPKNITPNNKAAILATLSWIKATNSAHLEWLNLNILFSALINLGELNPTDIAALSTGNAIDYSFSKSIVEKKFAANIINILANLIILGLDPIYAKYHMSLAIKLYGSGVSNIIRSAKKDIQQFSEGLATEFFSISWEIINPEINNRMLSQEEAA